MRPSPVTAWRVKSRKPTRSCRCRTSAKSRSGARRTCRAGSSSSSTRHRRAPSMREPHRRRHSDTVRGVPGGRGAALLRAGLRRDRGILLRRLRAGPQIPARRAAAPGRRSLARDLRAMLSSVLEGTAPSIARDPAAGGAHRLIFYGFVLLFVGTATITLEYDILEPLVRNPLLARPVLSGVLAGAGRGRRRADRGSSLHDVPARLAEAAEARLRAAGPRTGRSGLRPAAVPPRGLGVPVDAADHRLAPAMCSKPRGWSGCRTAPDVWDTRWWSPVGALLAEGMRALGLAQHGGGAAAAWPVVVSRPDRACASSR